MTEIAIKIAAKQGPDGITDEIAEQLHNKTKSSLIGVVELLVEERSERRDGKETVKMIITHFEPAVEQIGEEHLREFQRALHMNRKLHSPDAQLTIDTAEDLEPKVADVIAARPGIVPHEFQARPDVQLGEEPRCELAGCSEFENAAIHHPIVADPFTVPDDVDDDDINGGRVLCDFPDCVLDAEHDGDHDLDTVDEDPALPYDQRLVPELWAEIERRNDARPANGLPVIVPDFNRKADLIAALERDDQANSNQDGDA